jgi:hypothetical protein
MRQLNVTSIVKVTLGVCSSPSRSALSLDPGKLTMKGTLIQSKLGLCFGLMCASFYPLRFCVGLFSVLLQALFSLP